MSVLKGRCENGDNYLLREKGKTLSPSRQSVKCILLNKYLLTTDESFIIDSFIHSVLYCKSIWRIARTPFFIDAIFFTSFAERTLLTNGELRKLLQTFIEKKDVDGQRMKFLLQQHCMPLAKFIEWCETTFERVDFIAPSILTFLKCMSSTSPVCSYFPHSPIFLNLIAEVKCGLDIRNHPKKLQALHGLAPVIFSAILQFPTHLLPIQLLDLFETLEVKVKATFRQDPHSLQAVSADELPNSFSFLPNWPILNVRGLYKQDLVCAKDKSEELCTKEYRGHPTLMPGIFTLYCKHGKHSLVNVCVFFILIKLRIKARYKECTF